MTQPPPDWYPDPTGKPGLMYWDGRQWREEMTAAAPPANPSRSQRPTLPVGLSLIALGIIAGAAGFLFAVPIAWTLGVLVLIVGLVVMLVGLAGRR